MISIRINCQNCTSYIVFSKDLQLDVIASYFFQVKDQEPGLDEFLAWIEPQKDPKMFRIISFLRHVSGEVDFFDKYGVDKVI